MSWDQVDNLIRKAIEDRAFPGAVYLLADRDGVLVERVFGRQTYDLQSPPFGPMRCMILHH